MKKIALLVIGLSMIMSLSGCKGSQEVGKAVTNVMNEVSQAYGNMIAKINHTKNWFGTKVDQVDQAATDVENAADSIGEAVDSLKALSKLKDPSKTGDANATNDPLSTDPLPADPVISDPSTSTP